MTKSRFLEEIVTILIFSFLWNVKFRYPYGTIYNFFTNVFYINLMFHVFFQLADIYLHPDHLIQNLSIALIGLTTIIKIPAVRSNKLKRLVGEISAFEEEVFDTLNQRQKNIYYKHRRYVKVLNTSACVLTVLTSILFLIRPLLQIMYFTQPKSNYTIHDKPLPVGSWYPLDINKYYYICYFYQSVSILYTTSGVVVLNGLFIGFILFVTGRMKIVADKLRHLKSDFKGAKHNYNASKVIRNCIIEHNSIIRYVKLLDSVIYIFALTDFLVCTVQLALTGFWILVTNWGFQLGNLIFLLATMLCQMMCLYGCADFIISESLNLSLAIWECKWYDCDPSIQKTLMLMMMRAQKPLKLSVGPFYIMSNTTALMILKGAYTYLALLSKVYHNEK